MSKEILLVVDVVSNGAPIGGLEAGGALGSLHRRGAGLTARPCSAP